MFSNGMRSISFVLVLLKRRSAENESGSLRFSAAKISWAKPEERFYSSKRDQFLTKFTLAVALSVAIAGAASKDQSRITIQAVGSPKAQ
jgi:hypothetical protein